MSSARRPTPSAELALEKVQRVFSLKEAELHSILARAQQNCKYGASLTWTLEDFANELLGLDASPLEDRVAAIENEHSQFNVQVNETVRRFASVMKDVKHKCPNM